MSFLKKFHLATDVDSILTILTSPSEDFSVWRSWRPPPPGLEVIKGEAQWVERAPFGEADTVHVVLL